MTADLSGSALLLLFACALKATLVFAVAGIVAGIARDSSAAFRHLVWVSAILGALALPLLTCLLPAWRSAALGSTARFLSVSSQQAASQPDLSALPAMIVNAATSVPAHRWSSLFLLIWFVGILLFALRIVVGLARLRWLCSRCTPASSPDLMREASQLSACFNLPRRVLVIANHASFTMPMTWGIFRPIILLPSAAAGWPELRRRIVLTHEFAHIARRDWLFQICAEVACALYWFHPLAWLAARHLRQESERACDDAVLRSGVAAPDYAQHLLHLAAALSHRARGWSSALAIARASHLERRFTAMLNPSLDRRSLSSRATTAASLFVLLLLIPLAALRLPAQNAAGRFSGAILDPSAAVVPNATVIMTDSQTSKSAMTTTDLQGKFSFASLPSGEYDLRAIKRGFCGFQGARNARHWSGQNAGHYAQHRGGGL